MTSITHVDSENYSDVVKNSAGYVMLLTWQQSDDYEERLKPLLKELSDRYGKKITVAEMNKQDLSQVSNCYAVGITPYFLLLKDGVPVDHLEGTPLDTERLDAEWLQKIP